MKLLFSNFTALVLLLLSATSEACHSSCGKLGNITYPFRLKGDPHSCGEVNYELDCENNHTILHLYSGKYHVEEINYDNFTMRVVDVGLQKDNCSSLPLQSLMHGNFSHGDPYKLSASNSAVNFLECAAPVKPAPYMDTALCSKNSSSNLSLSQTHSYVVVGDIRASDVEDSCSIGMVVWVSNSHLKINNRSFSGIHNGLLYGTELLWPRVCYLDDVPGKERVSCGKTLPFSVQETLRMIRLNCFRYLLSFAKSKIFMLKRSSMEVLILICINSSVDPDFPFFPFLVYSLQWHGKPLYLDQLLSKISLSIFLLIKKCSVKCNAIIRFHPSCLLSLQINPKLLGFGHFGN